MTVSATYYKAKKQTKFDKIMMKKIMVTLLLGVFALTASLQAGGECCAAKAATTQVSAPKASSCCPMKGTASTAQVSATSCTVNHTASVAAAASCSAKHAGKKFVAKNRARTDIKGATLLAAR